MRDREIPELDIHGDINWELLKNPSNRTEALRRKINKDIAVMRSAMEESDTDNDYGTEYDL